jgi:hypothetical protein
MSKVGVAKDFAVEMRLSDVALETFWPSWLRLTVAKPILSFRAIWVGATYGLVTFTTWGSPESLANMASARARVPGDRSVPVRASMTTSSVSPARDG